MIKMYSEKKKAQIMAEWGPQIEELCNRYSIPAPWAKAIIRKEVAEIDWLDPVADLVVRFNWARYRVHRFLYRKGVFKNRGLKLCTGPFGKFDSSTGYGQIFASTAIGAANYAMDHGLETAEKLMPAGRPEDVAAWRPDRGNLDDLRAMWHRLVTDRKYNLQMAVLNLIAAADEMNGHTDFENYTEEEMQLAFTRYNANVRYVTDYGREVYGHARDFAGTGGISHV